MENYLVSGGKKLSGSVKIDSAKNSVLPILASTLLCKGQVVIQNCPKILDVLNMIKILEFLGVKCVFEQDNLLVNSENFCNKKIPISLTKELRSSVYLLGGILGIDNDVKIAYPGGCEIGKRPIDLHLNSFKKLGVTVKQYQSGVWCKYSNLKGGKIILPFPSVGCTENLILLSVLGNRKTIIYNCAKEPEIVDLANFLNCCGAVIRGAGTSRIEIYGVQKLIGCTYKPIFDRIEFGTYMIAGLITGGEIEFNNINTQNISQMLHKFLNNTCSIILNNDIIYIKSSKVNKSFSFETGPFPKFPTDMQPQTMALLSVSEGEAVVRETLFESRFAHAYYLNKMGADIFIDNNTALVKGVKRLHGERVCAKDLRGGASLVLAGLCAEGTTIIEGVNHIERGYLNLCNKLSSLGADIKKV